MRALAPGMIYTMMCYINTLEYDIGTRHYTTSDSTAAAVYQVWTKNIHGPLRDFHFA